MASHAPSPSLPLSDWLYASTGLVWANQREVTGSLRNADFAGEGQIIAWLVRKGRVTVRTSQGAAQATEGEWILPGRRKGRQIFEPGTTILSLRFYAEWPTGKTLFEHRDPLVFRATSQRPLTRAAEALEGIVRKVTRRRGFFVLSQGTADIESYFAIRQAFERWMLAYVRMMLSLNQAPLLPTSADPRALRAARHIDNWSFRQPWKEADVARAASLSVSHLNRLFAREWGISPKKYFQKRRLQTALLLLQHGKRSVKETAYELGFNAVSNFSNWFFREKGVYPRAFQESGG